MKSGPSSQRTYAAGVALCASAAITFGCAGLRDDQALPPPHGDGGWSVPGKDASSEQAVCTPATCGSLGANCGVAPDGCGSTLQCGSCSGGQTCGGGGPNVCGTNACVAKTCAEQAAACGVASDGCSATLDCGTCGSGQVCSNNQCACAPATCALHPNQCGAFDNGCGGTLTCDCPSPAVCTNGACCTPMTCAAAGAACGSLSNGCGGTLDCGNCSGTQTCNATTHQCSCVPGTCGSLGWSCGNGSDGCGGSLSCGSCTGNNACNAAHHCVCSPATCIGNGWECGSGPDNCGGTLNCPSCSTGVCDSTHHCKSASCGGKLCGSSDGVGGTCTPGSGCCGGLASGYVLPRNSSVQSCDGVAVLAHQDDGNVVVYRISTGTPMWSSNTAGLNTSGLAMQSDGNLVLYGYSSEVFWQTNTNGYSGAYAAIQDDCNFVVYWSSIVAWASNQVCP